MPYTFDQSKDEIARLVKHFSTNQAAFTAPGYKEAQARQEFIDPLFIALNWDVHNQQQTAPDYREVIVEDSLEMADHEARKAPDYVFRIGRDRKFFAEAKKPGVDLKTAAGPAYQLRRYAWSAKLPLSVLTDFQEWAAYDCRIRPSEKDKSTVARLSYMTYEEYADRWHEIWDNYSREAVWGGSFDKYAQGGRGKRGTSEVDAEFLKEIEGWRDSLARNIALRNPDLTLEEMNDAVQRTIDRIIFLRMVEARGMEEYGQLQKIAENENIYANLLVLSIRADAKYNSGLFDFSKAGDQVTPRLTVDDKTLKPILADLYYPQSPYEFSVLPVEILGNVYEQFLGKVIHLTDAHHAKVEEKPEVKKAGGVYYTPSYIVEYIVKNTVGRQIEDKSPTQLKGFRILDPACGSGSFLLGAYDHLLNYYRDWYGAHEPGKHKDAVAQQADGSWQLTLQERKRILIEHIFGVDIDHQAVEVTKLSLLLKVLEGIKQLTLFNERALPNLDNNIKCGNSLIGPDYFTGQIIPDADELRRVNPFDWKQGFPEAMQAGGFDCVIGNPPYGAFFNDKEKDYIRTKYKSYKYKYDSYIYFIEKALQLAIKKGFISFITPELWLKLENCAHLRKLISENAGFSLLRVWGENVFTNAVVNTIVFSLQRGVNVDNLIIETDFEKWILPSHTWMSADDYSIDYRLKPDKAELVNKINIIGEPLSSFGEMIQGITPYDKYRGQTAELIENRSYHANHKKNKSYRKWLAGKDVSRYALEWSGEWLSYGPWLAAPRTPRFFEGPRLLFREIPGVNKRIQATFVEQEIYYHGHSVTPFKLFSDNAIDLHYLLGLVNSKLLSWHGSLTLPNFGKSIFPKLNPQDISFLHIRPINSSDTNDKVLHDRMVALVKQMLELNKSKAGTKESAEQERLQRVIDSTDQQIDVLVYELYGLTPEEIAIVEGAAKG
jgi:hypothetical protein